MRTVVAFTVLLHSLFLEIVDAAHLTRGAVMHHDREHIGDGDLEVVLPLFHIGVGENGKRCGILRLPESLHGGELHRVCLCEVLRVEMSARNDADHADERVDGTCLDCLRERVARLRVVHQLPCGDRHDDKAGGRDARKERVRLLAEDVMVRYELREARHLGTPIGEYIANGVLHEGVRDENPEGRQVTAERDQPDADTVCLLREFVPAEHPDAEEGGLEEERRESLECERCAEDVAHEARILRPVHTKLELLHQTCDNTHREVDEKERTEEVQQLSAGLLPLRPFRPDVARLKQGDKDRHTKCDRDEEKVIDGSDCKLPSRQHHCFHVQIPPKIIPMIITATAFVHGV